ncbi:Hypothetical predicted protein [Xyrichtys novacula]|uniref:Uncharacterized protein n=1 Tax=Xyrichtys novacula TaxID=13765 RepID=A0AAV1F9J2_XYRNO|nr:Hypothetical predicted protein [Xyrichtys novacula]
MDDDKVESTVEVSNNPMATAFEPIRRGNRTGEVREKEVMVEPGVFREERLGNTTWCRCGRCMVVPTMVEYVVCQ